MYLLFQDESKEARRKLRPLPNETMHEDIRQRNRIRSECHFFKMKFTKDGWQILPKLTSQHYASNMCQLLNDRNKWEDERNNGLGVHN